MVVLRISSLRLFNVWTCCFPLVLYFTSIVAGTPKPLTCTFESADTPLCQWQQASGDVFDWTRNSGHTDTSNTGPQHGDNTYGSSAGYYLYTEVSSIAEGANARIISPTIDPYDTSCAMTLNYNMYGSSIGSLHVYTVPVNPVNGVESEVWSLSGNQGTNWHEAEITFNVAYQFQVVIEGVRSISFRGDIAIDDISFSNTCQKFVEGSLRIVPGSSDVNQGRIDIYINGTWGSICDRNFDISTDGVVACIQLGYRRASSSIYLVPDSKPPILDNVECLGNETRLLDCVHDGIGVIHSSCNANRVVNLKCSDIIDICDDIVDGLPFYCDNIHCIPSDEKCNFFNNCGDNSDEATSICDPYPGRNSFQTDFGEWSQPETNGIDWSRRNGGSSSGGPLNDHNYRSDEYFLIIDGSNVGKKAQLCLDMTFEATTNCSIRFYYYRNTVNTGTIKLIQRTTQPTEIWEMNSGYESSSQWFYEDLKITSSESFHVCFEATISSSGVGYLGLDDVSLTPECTIGSGECELSGPIFTCNNGLCIHAEYLCDHVHHCLDGSDENSTLCQERVGYCTFQDDFCDWEQSSTDHFDWARIKGETPTPNTGPTTDHTFENHFGYYAYLEVSGKTNDDYADLLSPWLTFSESCELRVFYHMEGTDIGNLQVGTQTRTSSFTGLLTEQFSRSYWRDSTVIASNNVQVNTEFRFVIRATVGNGVVGDIAIDDLSLSDGCIPFQAPTTRSPSSEQTRSAGAVVPTEATTTIGHQNDRTTEAQCDLQVMNQHSSSCNGYEVICRNKNIIITVQSGGVSCTWQIETKKDSVLKVKFTGMDILENDEVTVDDSNNNEPMRINNENKEWTSQTHTIKIKLTIQSRIKRSTETMPDFIELEIQSEPRPTVESTKFQTGAVVVATGAFVVVIIVVIVLVIVRWKKALKKPGPRALYRADAPADDHQGGGAIAVDLYAERIYNKDDFKLMSYGEGNGVVALPFDKMQTSIHSVSNEYAEMGKVPPPPSLYATEIKKSIPQGIYLVPDVKDPPPTYEEICPIEPSVRGTDNPVYHGIIEGRINDQKVYEFLKNLDLQKYAQVLENEFVVFDDIPYIEAHELKDMGMNKQEINRFLRRAKQYGKKKKQVSPSEDAYENVPVPPKFLCPLSRRVMEQPVIAADNETYDYKNIFDYLKNHNKSPVTGEILPNHTLSPNVKICDELQKYKAKREIEHKRKQRQLRRERSALSESRPETPMTDIEC